jgi:transcription elongation factor GreA
MRTTNRKSEAEHHVAVDPHISRRKYDTLVGRLAACHAKKVGLAKEVAELATLGDFSENFEYQQAKRTLRRNHNQILKLQHRIDTAIIIKPEASSIVLLGSTVTVEVHDEERTYTIMGSSEVDVSKGIISHTSPIGRVLLGASVGDTVFAELPKGIVDYTITTIE